MTTEDSGKLNKEGFHTMAWTPERQADYYAEALEPYTLAALQGLLASAAGTIPPTTADDEFAASVADAAVRIAVACQGRREGGGDRNAMQSSKAARLRQAWEAKGNPPCNHPHVEK